MIILALLQLLVCALILCWVLKRKTGNAFSAKKVAKYLLFGALSCVLLLLLPLPLERDTFFGMNPLLSGFLTAFLTAALLEEVSKYLFFRLALIHDQEVVNWHDAILAAILVGMGFTLLEDIEFTITGGATLTRAILPAHLLFQAIMGYYYGKARVTKKAGYDVLSLVMPVVCHTVFDMFLIGLMSIFGGNIPSGMTEEEMLALPYYNYTIPMLAAAIIILVLTLAALILVFRKIGKWSKTGEKQELLKPEMAQTQRLP